MSVFSTLSDALKKQVLPATRAAVQISCIHTARYHFVSEMRQRACPQFNIDKLTRCHLMFNRICGFLPQRWSAITLVLVMILMFSNMVFAQDPKFATDTVSILQQLSDSQSNTTSTSKGGISIKGDVFVPTETSKPDSSSVPVTVLQEVEEKGVASRAFGVVQRQSVAQRVNLQILFDIDSSSIRQESYPLLQSLGNALRTQELAGQVMAVNGHTDSSGSEDYNLQLSFERARSVRDYLVNREGIDHSQLKVFGFGEGVPLVANNSSDNRQTNRRVEIERSN